jgi:IS30 family transposase
LDFPDIMGIMSKTYRHLSEEERDILAVWRGEGKSLRQMARALGRHVSTVSRELKRNCGPNYKWSYFAHSAQGRARQRWHGSHQRQRLKDPEVRAYVRTKLQQGWSPELIAGRLKREPGGRRISHEAIYQWIYAQAPELKRYLARARPKRRWRGYGRRGMLVSIPRRISIRHRPKVVGRRRQWGHWEADTMVDGYRRAGIQVVVERRTRYSCLSKLVPLSPVAMRRALGRRLSRFPPGLRRTLTYDNGSENTQHYLTNQRLGTQSYFCDPYQSWQRGTVENTIGLARRWLPKKTDLLTLSPVTVKWVEQWLNHRPRKCLDYRTPAEVLKSASVALTR